ncbi:hypothetical protein ACJJTC_013016, partial [Scirpophaga incertulas]
MSKNLENERSVGSGKMYPIDLAPQKITIVKNVSNTEVKMSHLLPGQSKTSTPAQIMTHTGPVGLMRPNTQIIAPSVASQPQMIVSGTPLLQGTQITSQGSQLLGQSSQIISQSHLINPSGQILSPGTQIISQGSQLSGQVSINSSINNVQSIPSTTVSGSQVLNVGAQLGANLVVSSSVRTLSPSVRVLSPLSHHNTRPVLSNVNVTSAGGVLVNKTVGMTSHVPRGLAAGAALAVRPATPVASQNIGAQGSMGFGLAAVVEVLRCMDHEEHLLEALEVATPIPVLSATPLPAVGQSSTQSPQTVHTTVVTMPPTTVLTTSGVISSAMRNTTPRLQAPAPVSIQSTPRPLPLLQRNYQPKVVGVASVGVRGVVGNSAPTQLYYEVPRATTPTLPQSQQPQHHPPHQPVQLQSGQHQPGQLQSSQHQQPQLQQSRPLTQYSHNQPLQAQSQSIQVNAIPVLSEVRTSVVSSSAQSTPVVPRPSILRKRDIEGSPTKPVSATPVTGSNVSTLNNVSSLTGITALSSVSALCNVSSLSGVNVLSSVSSAIAGAKPGWEDVPASSCGPGSGGSTTISASSSPAPDDEPEPPRIEDISPRKKPRKQLLTNEIRQCEYIPEETPPTPPPPVTATPPTK